MDYSAEIHNNIFVRRAGSPTAKKLLLLPGFADNGSMFLPLIETSLVEQFELILVDLPGTGASPPNYDLKTIAEYGAAIAALAEQISPNEAVGLVGHSVASAIAVMAAPLLRHPAIGLFSMEGNLTEEDAYFSGTAADYADAHQFKQAFTARIWEMAQTTIDLRRYYGAVVMADAVSLWQLGRSARQISQNNAVGHAYKALTVPNLYYWSAATTPANTQQFIRDHTIANLQYEVASHWPSVSAPEATAAAIADFFG